MSPRRARDRPTGRAFGQEGGTMSRIRRGLAPPMLVGIMALVSASCAGGDEPAPRVRSSPAAQEGAFPVTVGTANGRVTIEARPERIVSLSPTSTEILFAIGAGDQVVAVDSNSNYPPEAPVTDLFALEPNVEAVAEFEPDVVVLSDDTNDIVQALVALEIPTILHPAAQNLDDTYTQIEQLGVATGHQAEAAEVVSSMRSEIQDLSASVPGFERPPTYYHELDQTFFSVTSETFIGQVYRLVGLENIADEAKEGGDYPQLSSEFIVDADPDVIFLSDTKCCGVTADKVARRPGWEHITAVETGAIVELDDDVASRWGPRIVDLLRAAVAEVSELRAASV
jgi:iron complex transport system substrate-binding protein